MMRKEYCAQDEGKKDMKQCGPRVEGEDDEKEGSVIRAAIGMVMRFCKANMKDENCMAMMESKKKCCEEELRRCEMDDDMCEKEEKDWDALDDMKAYCEKNPK